MVPKIPMEYLLFTFFMVKEGKKCSIILDLQCFSIFLHIQRIFQKGLG